MTVRPPAQPPKIAGFSYLRHLGSGGFADVFLYEEDLLHRQVAVKVLLSGQLGADALANFTNEANLMAQLSNHPSIVSVYQAGISEGRPFIAMEYCSRPNLQARYRAGRFSEAETLRIGIQIAGAVETAHRAGILHRDIKPANILVTQYGRPALTDFGIAATTSSGAQLGLSVPWAPPESFVAGVIGDERADVYSLGATLYTLLAGRTPYELPGTSNTSVEVMGRIQTGTLPPIGRQDVSASLERVLATSMARRVEDRYRSAMEFARALQRVQVELGMQPTTVDVVEDSADIVEHEEDDGRTRIRSIVTIDAQRTDPVPTSRGVTVAPTEPEIGDTRKAFVMPTAPEVAPVEETQLRAPAGTPTFADAQPSEAPATAATPRGRIVGIALGGVALLAVAVTIGVVLSGGSPAATSKPPVSSAAQPIDVEPYEGIVPKVKDLVGAVKGDQVTFTWTNPEPKAGDTYMWHLEVPGEEHPSAQISEATVTIPKSADGSTCIGVALRRANGRGSEDFVRCAK